MRLKPAAVGFLSRLVFFAPRVVLLKKSLPPPPPPPPPPRIYLSGGERGLIESGKAGQRPQDFGQILEEEDKGAREVLFLRCES